MFISSSQDGRSQQFDMWKHPTFSPHNTTLAMMQIGLELQYMTTYDRYVNSKLIKQSDVVDPVPRTIPANHQRIHDHLA